MKINNEVIFKIQEIIGTQEKIGLSTDNILNSILGQVVEAHSREWNGSITRLILAQILIEDIELKETDFIKWKSDNRSTIELLAKVVFRGIFDSLLRVLKESTDYIREKEKDVSEILLPEITEEYKRKILAAREQIETIRVNSVLLRDYADTLHRIEQLPKENASSDSGKSDVVTIKNNLEKRLEAILSKMFEAISYKEDGKALYELTEDIKALLLACICKQSVIEAKQWHNEFEKTMSEISACLSSTTITEEERAKIVACQDSIKSAQKTIDSIRRRDENLSTKRKRRGNA